MTRRFNWSTLNRKDLIEQFWALHPKVTNTEITILKFHNTITRYLKKYLPIKVAKKYDKKVSTNWIYVGGTYYSDLDQEGQKCIELVFVYSSLQDVIKIPLKRYKNICYVMADTILHELMHMHQYRSRKFKILPDYASTASKTKKRQEQEYLGNSDEIDAYGFNIACELLSKFKNNTEQVIQYLNEDQKGLRRKHNSWRMYLKAFDHDHDHPIIRRTKKKVIKYLPQAVIGKPYRNKDWINR